MSDHHSPGSPESHSSEEHHHHHHSESCSAPTTVSDSAPHDGITAALQDGPREKKRRRPALACEQCRKRKVRCDRTKPCGPCLKARISPCTYAPTHTPSPRGRKTNSTSAGKPANVAAVTAQSSPEAQQPGNQQYELRPAAPVTRRGSVEGVWSTLKGVVQPPVPESHSRSSKHTSVDGYSPEKSGDVEWLIQRVNFLQEKLNSVTRQEGAEVDGEGVKRWPGQATLEHQKKGAIIKTRYYSCGHWMHGVYLFPTELSILVQAETSKSELYWSLTHCKELARQIKAARLQPIVSTNIGQSLPNRALADELVENYIRAIEGTVRILHIPNFRSEYERFWQNPESANTAFVMQLQLCLAIGACFQDETFTLRKQAMQWVYEAQIWMMLPPEKDRLTYMGLQVMCLICLARTVCSVGPDLAWLGGGQLLRMAMYMGLHRDPRKLGAMSVYRAEMRRRLWATVMELDLQFSVDAGTASLLHATDYDTLAPANLNDDELTDDLEKERLPNSENAAISVATQTSIQIALHRSVPVRLAVLSHVNGLHIDDSYNTTLGLNSRLTKECRLLSKTLHDLKASTESNAPDERDKGLITSFHIKMAEISVYRCFHTLHQPIIIQSLEDPRFYFSRKMYLDSALKTAGICGLTSRHDKEGYTTQTLPERDFARFLNNGAGMIRYTVAQSMMGIGVRILHLKEEQPHSLGYFHTGFDDGMPSEEIKVYLNRTIELCKRRIRSGETGIKILCFVSAAMARHEQMEAGAERSVVHAAILEKAAEASRIGFELLKERARFEGTPVPAEASETNKGEAAPGLSPQSLDQTRGIGNPTIFGSLQALGSGRNGNLEGMDWMMDWAWDDMSEFGWPPSGGQQIPAWNPAMGSGPGDLAFPMVI